MAKRKPKKSVVTKKIEPPEYVKVGYQDFKLIFEPFSVDNAGHYGLTHKVKSYITVTQMGNPVEQVNTLIHECLHAICHTQGIKLDNDTEEMVVNNMANGLVGLIRENPKLIHYLLDQLEMI